MTNLVDILFPPKCVSCKRQIDPEKEGGIHQCLKCQKKIKTYSSFFCPHCSRRLIKPNICCQSKTIPKEARFVLASVSSYQIPETREMIHALKYSYVSEALGPIEKAIREYLQKIEIKPKPKNFIIVPAPLHKRKEFKRGFNQSLLISKILKNCLEETYSFKPLLLETNAFIKAKSTEAQVKIQDYEERARNVRGSFKLKNARQIKGENILLVDDVFTSGATMKEMVRILKTGGARKVIGFVIAKR